ncbi:hypothetical protein EON62_01585 [archaeon]|nr:MAG: hypothetical protein EON62_01585 [archaeon]
MLHSSSPAPAGRARHGRQHVAPVLLCLLVQLWAPEAATQTVTTSAAPTALPSSEPNFIVEPANGVVDLFLDNFRAQWIRATQPAGSSVGFWVRQQSGCLDIRITMNSTWTCYDANACTWDYTNMCDYYWCQRFNGAIPGAPYAQAKTFYIYVKRASVGCTQSNPVISTIYLATDASSASPSPSVPAATTRTPTSSTTPVQASASMPVSVSATPSPSALPSGVAFQELRMNGAPSQATFINHMGALFRFVQPANVGAEFLVQATRGQVTAFLGRRGFPSNSCANATRAADCSFQSEINVTAASAVATGTSTSFRRLAPLAVLPAVSVATSWYVLIINDAVTNSSTCTFRVQTTASGNGGASPESVEGLSPGAKTGIGIGVAILLLLGVAALGWYLWTRKRAAPAAAHSSVELKHVSNNPIAHVRQVLVPNPIATSA